jgi:hypothetical protein
MKSALLVVPVFCVSFCVAQTVNPHNARQADFTSTHRLGEMFVKTSLRAVLAMNRDYGVDSKTIHLLVIDAGAEAVTADELSIVRDLQAMTDSRDFDPTSTEDRRTKNQECRNAMETMLRSRTFSHLDCPVANRSK